MIGVDLMDLDDSMFGGFGFTERSKEFINVKSNRIVQDKQTVYQSADKTFSVELGKC